jgi:hypothetical protein
MIVTDDQCSGSSVEDLGEGRGLRGSDLHGCYGLVAPPQRRQQLALFPDAQVVENSHLGGHPVERAADMVG